MAYRTSNKAEEPFSESVDDKILLRAEKLGGGREGSRLRSIFRPRIMGFVSVIVLWEICAIITPEGILPTPYVVGKEVIFETILEEGFLAHVGTTVLRILIGFGLAFLIGLTMGIAMGARKFWEDFFSDYVVIGLTIPSLAWAVIGVLWFGLRPLTPVFATVMIAFPYVAVNIWEGVKNVDKDLVDMGRAFGVRKGKIVRHIYLPSLTPFLFAGLRLGFAISWKIVIIAEVFGASNGIGYMIYYWYGMFNMRQVLAWVLLFTFMMLFIEYGIIRRLERRILAWRPEAIL